MSNRQNRFHSCRANQTFCGFSLAFYALQLVSNQIFRITLKTMSDFFREVEHNKIIFFNPVLNQMYRIQLYKYNGLMGIK